MEDKELETKARSYLLALVSAQNSLQKAEWDVYNLRLKRNLAMQACYSIGFPSTFIAQTVKGNDKWVANQLRVLDIETAAKAVKKWEERKMQADDTASFAMLLRVLSFIIEDFSEKADSIDIAKLVSWAANLITNYKDIPDTNVQGFVINSFSSEDFTIDGKE